MNLYWYPLIRMSALLIESSRILRGIAPCTTPMSHQLAFLSLPSGRASVELRVVLRPRQKKHRRNSAQGEEQPLYLRGILIPLWLAVSSSISNEPGFGRPSSGGLSASGSAHPRMTGLGSVGWISSGQRVGNLSIERPSCGPLRWTGGGVRTRVRLSPASSWVV